MSWDSDDNDDRIRVGIGSIDVTFNKIPFRYDGYNLCHKNYTYDSRVADYLPRVTLTPTGRVSKKQIQPQKQLVGWWKAQCLFRGLDTKGTIEELQNRLKPAPAAPMSNELLASIREIKKGYRDKQHEAGKIWE